MMPDPLRSSRPRRSPHGFTLIEVVIAIAIGVMIVVAVIGTVQSLNRAAQRVEETGADEDAWLRFAEIFRRDVRGWVQSQNEEPERPNQQQEQATPFFDCHTSADGLAACVHGGEVPGGRMAHVRYSAESKDEEFVISRHESSGETTFSVPLFCAEAQPVIEFFDGQQWLAAVQNEQRPVAVRLTVGKRTVVVGCTGTAPEIETPEKRSK